MEPAGLKDDPFYEVCACMACKLQWRHGRHARMQTVKGSLSLIHTQNSTLNECMNAWNGFKDTNLAASPLQWSRRYDRKFKLQKLQTLQTLWEQPESTRSFFHGCSSPLEIQQQLQKQQRRKVAVTSRRGDSYSELQSHSEWQSTDFNSHCSSINIWAAHLMREAPNNEWIGGSAKS